MKTASGMHIEVFRSVNEIDEQTWDQLAPPDDLLARLRFVRLCEESGVEDAEYWHVLIFDVKGLAATLSITRMSARLDAVSSHFLRTIAELVRTKAPNFLRVEMLFCGLPVSFGQLPINFRSDADRHQIMKKICDLIEELHQNLGCQLCVFKEFSDKNDFTGEPIETFGFFRAPSLPYHSLKVEWKSFSEYLMAMRAPYRRQIKQDSQKASRASLDLQEVDDFGDLCPRIFALYQEVMRHTSHSLEVLPLAFFENLNKLYASETRALLLRCNGQIVGSAILMQSGGRVLFLLAGIDQNFNKEYHFYPFLLGRVIAAGIHSGATYIGLGQTSDKLKSRFGAAADGRWIYLRHMNPWVHRLLRQSSGVLFPKAKQYSRKVFKGDQAHSPNLVAF